MAAPHQVHDADTVTGRGAAIDRLNGEIMNFDDAVSAHTRWMVRLRACIDGSGETFDATVVARDDACDLGRWILGEGGRFKALPEHQALRTAHAKFHECAAEVVNRNSKGQKAEAEKLMANGGEFSRHSTQTVSAIMAMQRAVVR